MKKQQPIRAALRGKSKHLVILCLQFTISSFLFSQYTQSRYWYLGDHRIDFGNPSNPVSFISGGPHALSTYSGAYWTNGTSTQHEVTVTDNDVYGLDNNSVWGYGGTLSTEGSGGSIGGETVVIPKPGNECSQYLIL